jgi:deoxyhypusine monooxygenase
MVSVATCYCCYNHDSNLTAQKFLLDAAPEVSETCQVAIDSIQWRLENAVTPESLLDNDEFSSIDPAPPASKKEKSVQQLRELLLNPDKPTFKRYRALFSLRNINTSEAVLAVCDALNTGSDLFRHEVAFVLGQMEHPASVPALVKALQDKTQHAMVRHEAAEALGSIASPEVISAISKITANVSGF